MEGVSDWTKERTDTAVGRCVISSPYSIAIPSWQLDPYRPNLYFARQIKGWAICGEDGVPFYEQEIVKVFYELSHQASIEYPPASR
jgi:hypothetical protein